MKKKIIVVLSHPHLPWNFPGGYARQTSIELSKKANVLVFSPLGIPTLKNLLTNRKKRKEWLSFFGEKKITYFPSLAIFPFQRFKFIEKLNISLNLLAFRLFYLLKFGFKKPIFWVFSYPLVELKDYFRWGEFLVYDRVDQPASLDPKIDKAIKQTDRSLLKRADYVFAHSPYALKYIKRYNKRSFLVPCGCTVDLFMKKKTSLPKEIKKIKKPIIGFVGSFDHRINFKIINPLARKRRDWNFVFIGGHFSDDKAQFRVVNLNQRIKKIGRLSNVYFISQKPKEKMPDFIASFDVCLIPYDTSQEFVRGCNPIKLYEYLAMGKPVVSIPIEAVKQYSPTVKIASDANGFEKAIEKFTPGSWISSDGRSLFKNKK